MTLVRSLDVEAVEMMPGVFRRTLHSGEREQMVHITFRPGAEVPLHSHPHEQVGVVVRGRLRMRIGEQELDMAPGDSYLIHSGVAHSAVAAEEEVVVIDVFSPPRDEYR